MRFNIQRREKKTRWLSAGVPISSILLSLVAVGVIFAVYGVNPWVAYTQIFRAAFGSFYGISETFVKTIPLLLCSLGLVVAFKAQIWNIGAEGQLFMGAIASTWVALSFPDMSAYLLLPIMFVVGFMAGALWGFIPGILKAKLQTNEVISSLMFTYVAAKLLEYLVYGPWREPGALGGFPHTPMFSPSAQLPRISGTRLHYPTLIIGLILAGVLFVLLRRTKIGYEIRVTGDSQEAARFAGMNYLKTVVFVMAISGGLAGLAGVGEVAGIQHRLRKGISPGYGFTAIIVAWLGRLNPIGAVFSSILFGGLLVGGDMIQVSLGLPVAAIHIFNGIMLFFVLGGEIFLHYEIKWER